MATYDVSTSDTARVGSSSRYVKIVPQAISSTATVRDSVSTSLSIFVSMVDNTTATGSLSGARGVVESVSDTVFAHGDMSITAIINAFLSDKVRVGVDLTFRGVVYDGWVVNPNTFASARYQGFNFNSFCQYQGQYYGCADNGIHLLEGDDDNGTAIDAYIATGNVKPFSRSQSRLMSAYLLVSNSGSMFVKVIYGDVVYTYEMPDISPHLKERRVKVGKGLKSTFYRFEISNKDGADFDLDSFKIFPIELTRRQ